MNKSSVVILLLFNLTAIIRCQTQLSVLFIGNSFTYYYDMPSQVAQFALNANQLPDIDSITYPGWTLQQHWNNQATLDKINSRVWDVVVLQEYSSGLAHDDATVCRDSYPYVKNLVAEVKKGSPDALIQFYLTWGRPDDYQDPNCVDNGGTNPLLCDFETMQNVVTANYRKYACMFKPSQVAPVGEAFRTAKETYGYDYWADLYVPGDYHSSPEGTYLAAAAHFSQLWNTDAVSNPFVGDIEPNLAFSLQSLSDTTLHADPTYWEFPIDSTCTECICECP